MQAQNRIKNLGRYLSIDYGRARIGSALTDEKKIIASPFHVFPRSKNIALTFAAIKEKLQAFLPIELIIIGLPLLLNGQEGPMALEAKAFGNDLSTFLQIPCIFWDERLSSSQADRLMKEDGLSRKKRAQSSDTLAATLVLQSYLDFCSRKK
jgi:putative Holliday junction resolvase